ncbi:MAG TPA: PTS mannose/fructose/sorbose transporter subunit IIB [Proteobacteria bacterium]|nr:fructose-specific phosphotransferase enzyme IIB component [bacterium BMS3Abin14]HDL52860.1 PTS mannose/fructose/sorbose transporter subunit IIB [Pseudomonadota bacterium]
MPVVLARVDDRLVHGQIIESWVPHLQADFVCVIGDKIFEDGPRCRLMRMIVPVPIVFSVVSTAGLKSCLEHRKDKNVLLLFGSLADVLTVARNGVSIGAVNIGNLHHLRRGLKVSPSVFLDRNDIEILGELLSLGIGVEAMDLPGGRSYDLSKIALSRGDVQ